MQASTRFLFLTLVMGACTANYAQSQNLMAMPATDTSGTVPEYETGNIRTSDLEASREYALRSAITGHFQDFLQDQKQIWSSPARVRFSDATWLVPLGGVAAGLFAT